MGIFLFFTAEGAEVGRGNGRVIKRRPQADVVIRIPEVIPPFKRSPRSPRLLAMTVFITRRRCNAEYPLIRDSC
jgi:hypothetical protein